MMPRLAAPMVCPDRPMRCIPLATDGGASIWMTRSIAPMSMPSSSDEVATSPRMSPALRRSSTSIRCGRASDPWCDRTSVSPASSLSALGQPLGDAPAVDEDQRRAMRRDELEQPRVDGRPDRRPHRALRRGSARDVLDLADAGHVLDRHFDRQVEPLLLRGVDDGRRNGRPRRAMRLRGSRGRSAQESRHFVERALRGREADALERCGVRPGGSLRAARATARGGRRAWSARARGSRR